MKANKTSIYAVSSFSKIMNTKQGKKWHNSISRKAIGYDKKLENILPAILSQELNTTATNLEEKIIQVITSECLYRGLIIPFENLDNEVFYLQNLTPFIRPPKSFFNCPVIDHNALVFQ